MDKNKSTLQELFNDKYKDKIELTRKAVLELMPQVWGVTQDDCDLLENVLMKGADSQQLEVNKRFVKGKIATCFMQKYVNALHQQVENCRKELADNDLKNNNSGNDDIIGCTDKEPFYVFDPVNSIYAEAMSKKLAESLPHFVKLGGELNIPDEQGYYGQGEEFASYCAFVDADEENSIDVLSKALDVTIKKCILPRTEHKVTKNRSSRFLCFQPDDLDHFSPVRRVLFKEYKGKRFFSKDQNQRLNNVTDVNAKMQLTAVPRSIVAFYGALNVAEEENLSKQIWYLDCDTPNPILVKLIVDKIQIQGKYYIVPMRCSIQHTSIAVGYEDICNCYINEYCAKHTLKLTRQEISNIISTKILVNVIKKHEKVLVHNTIGGFAYLAYDKDIYDTVVGKFINQLKKAKISNNELLLIASNILGRDIALSNGEILDFQTMCKSANELTKRIKKEVPLWYEYMPDWKLEVNQNGRFEEIELVSEEQKRQAVIWNNADNDNVIEVTNAKEIAFPAHKSNLSKTQKIYLPLKRKEKNAKEKLACFELKEPLSQSVAVKLFLKFNFNDADDIVLEAKNRDTGEPIGKFHWCDWEERDKLENPWPEFYPAFSRLEDKTILFINRGFKKFKENYRDGRFDGENFLEYFRSNAFYYEIQRFFDKQSKNDTEIVYKNNLNSIHLMAITLDQGKLMATILNNKFDFYLDQDELERLRYNIADMVQWFGYFYDYSDDYGEQQKLYEDSLETILEFFNSEEAKRAYQDNRIKSPYMLAITRMVDFDNDRYHLWKGAISFLEENLKMKSLKLRSILRTMAVISWQSKEWVKNFYQAIESYADYSLIEKLIVILQKSIRKEMGDMQRKGTYNGRIIRDYLELLLSILRLREFNDKVFDSNEPETRDFISVLKELDNLINILEANRNLEKPIKARIENVQVPQGFYRMNKLVYANIELLSGGENGTVRLEGIVTRD